MKKAFTLVELLLVVGIIAILIGVFVAMSGGGTESARAAKCLTNMKNLVVACNGYGMTSTWYPAAGSYERKHVGYDGSGKPVHSYEEVRGWISWNSDGAYSGGNARSHVSSAGWFTSTYNQDLDTREYALHHGAIWGHVAGSASVYQCPSHLKACPKEKPLWSYVMNQKFGYDKTLGSGAHPGYRNIEYGELSRADRILMFAELQFLKNDKVEVNMDESSGIRNDCTLQYGKDEIIGFNHPNGKRQLYAHVAFADGHVEKLSIPATYSSSGWNINLSVSELKDLTTWLCQGKDVAFNGSKYEKLED